MSVFLLAVNPNFLNLTIDFIPLFLLMLSFKNETLAAFQGVVSMD